MSLSNANADLAAGMTGLDDLPRTLRREHEARAREAREREARERERSDREARDRDTRERDTKDARSSHAMARDMDMVSSPSPPAYLTRDQLRRDVGDEPVKAAVIRFDVPFFRLMLFFLKAVVAAVPALIVLGVMLWFAGKGLEAYVPELVRMKVMITFPKA